MATFGERLRFYLSCLRLPLGGWRLHLPVALSPLGIASGAWRVNRFGHGDESGKLPAIHAGRSDSQKSLLEAKVRTALLPVCRFPGQHVPGQSVDL